MQIALAAALAGFAAGLSLIIAIGSQNAFVLRQGLLRQHVGPVVAVCAASDLLLVTAGVAGMGTLVAQVPAVVDAVRWAGVAFLTAYAVVAFRRALRGGEALTAERTGRAALGAVVAQAVALTWLNPHVYLDTVLLLGSLAASHGERWWFGTGAVVASVVWFVGLGYGAGKASRWFARPAAWRALDAFVGCTMVAVAASLALQA